MELYQIASNKKLLKDALSNQRNISTLPLFKLDLD